MTPVFLLSGLDGTLMVARPQSAWLATLATLGGYAVVLVVMTVLLFLVPYLAFTLL